MAAPGFRLSWAFIAFFKDTSLVIVIGPFDLLGAAKAVIVDAKWVGFGVEVYLFWLRRAHARADVNDVTSAQSC